MTAEAKKSRKGVLLFESSATSRPTRSGVVKKAKATDPSISKVTGKRSTDKRVEASSSHVTPKRVKPIKYTSPSLDPTSSSSPKKEEGRVPYLRSRPRIPLFHDSGEVVNIELTISRQSLSLKIYQS